MPRLTIGLLAVAGLMICSVIGLRSVPGAPADSIFKSISTHRVSAAAGPTGIPLHTSRVSQMDLEVGGDLAGVPAGETRYITRGDLLMLPQMGYTVSDDSNFRGPTRVDGVLLDTLVQSLGASPQSDLVIAICDDQYRANYSRAYIANHHPLLVLQVNGEDPDDWPKDSEGHGNDMGPYIISHPSFTSSFKVLSDSEEAQIPWGVVRIEIRDEKTVFGAIRPHGPNPEDEAVQAGFRIAQQNCFRCHNMGAEGGKKSGVPWIALSQIASASPELFGNYVRNPVAVFPKAQMPGNPNYDDATIKALTAYFQNFSAPKNR